MIAATRRHLRAFFRSIDKPNLLKGFLLINLKYTEKKNNLIDEKYSLDLRN